jgi:hypothetical protein
LYGFSSFEGFFGYSAILVAACPSGWLQNTKIYFTLPSFSNDIKLSILYQMIKFNLIDDVKGMIYEPNCCCNYDFAKGHNDQKIPWL